MKDKYIFRYSEIENTCKPSQGQNIKANMYHHPEHLTQRFKCTPHQSFYSKSYVYTFKNGLGRKKVIAPHVKHYPFTNLAPIENRDYSEFGIDLKKLSNFQSINL